MTDQSARAFLLTQDWWPFNQSTVHDAEIVRTMEAYASERTAALVAEVETLRRVLKPFAQCEINYCRPDEGRKCDGCLAAEALKEKPV